VSRSLRSCCCAGRGKNCNSTPSPRRGDAGGERGPAAPLQRSAAEQTAQRGRNAARRVSAVVPAVSLQLRGERSLSRQRRRLSTRRAQEVTSCR